MQNTSNKLKKTPITAPLPSCWVITEGMVGTENQCIGIANALGLSPQITKIGLRQPWRTLSPWLGFENASSFTHPLNAPWPDIVIASGRKSIAAARYIKRMSKGKTFTVQVQDPKINPKNFDLVAVPFHDDMRGENVIVTHGAPNKITAEQLALAKEKFAPIFEKMPTPRVAVLIGGNSKTHTLTPDITKTFTQDLNALNASLMITASRRTGEENFAHIQRALSNDKNFIWNGNGDNPYLGMLAWADHIIVTEDSVSMLSDAATTGKPVHVIQLEGRSKRFDKCHQHFQDIGVSRCFSGGNLETWNYEAINDAQMVAHAIKKKLGIT